MILFILALVFTIVQFVIFALVLVATPLPMFRSKHLVLGEHFCVTLWGATTKCYGSKYSSRDATAFGCDRRTSTMQCAQAFAIISILTTVCAFVLGVLMVVKKVGAVGPLIVSIVSVVTIVVCWGCVANVMTVKMCGVIIGYYEFPATKLSTGYDYGAGFAMMVTAWCLELGNLALLIVLLCLKCRQGGDRRNQQAMYEVPVQSVSVNAQPAKEFYFGPQ